MDEILKQILITQAGKIDILLIGKSIIEIVIFIVILRLVNTGLKLSFEKAIERIKDTETRKHYHTLEHVGLYLINAIVILFFATNILENFGINMKPILATAGVLGVAVGFGGKKFVEDLFTGLSIILTGQLRVGDYVTVNNSTGTVEKITLTMIVIRAYNGDVHFMRNGQIDTVINQTKNFSYPLFRIGVAYKTNITHVIEVLKDLGREIKENPEAAIVLYQTASVLNPESEDCHIAMGDLFFSQEDYESAIKAYCDAIKINPENARAYGKCGMALWENDFLEEAIVAYNKAINLDPEYAIAYNNLGVIYLDGIGNVKEAARLFEKSIKINPLYTLANFNMARAYQAMGDLTDAAEYFQKSLDLNKTSHELDEEDIITRLHKLFEV